MKAAKGRVRAAQKERREFVEKHGDVLRRDYWRERYEGMTAIPVKKNAAMPLAKKGPSDYTEKREPILSAQEVIERTKQLAQDLVDGRETLRRGNGSPTMDYIVRRLGYDALPRVATRAEFEALAQVSDGVRLYRGFAPYDGVPGKAFTEQYCTDSLFGERKSAFGNGTYFSPDRELVLKQYAYQPESAVITGLLREDARIADYWELNKEFLSTKIPMALYRKDPPAEFYERLLDSISEYAALKGYDAMAFNGVQGHRHYIVLNRGKMIVEGADV